MFFILFCHFFTLNLDFKFAKGGSKGTGALSVNERIAPTSK
jgi:hypothetical protein